MTDTGYSDKPLAQKLGFAAGDIILVQTTPDWYTKFADENGLELTPFVPATNAHIFCNSRSELASFLDETDLADIEKSLWISWPKQASGVKTDLAEQDLRDSLLPLGWVDVKVCAVDDTWSGLTFLRRKG